MHLLLSCPIVQRAVGKMGITSVETFRQTRNRHVEWRDSSLSRWRLSRPDPMDTSAALGVQVSWIQFIE
jgi:hypothetical protein